MIIIIISSSSSSSILSSSSSSLLLLLLFLFLFLFLLLFTTRLSRRLTDTYLAVGTYESRCARAAVASSNRVIQVARAAMETGGQIAGVRVHLAKVASVGVRADTSVVASPLHTAAAVLAGGAAVPTVSDGDAAVVSQHAWGAFAPVTAGSHL